MINPPCGKNALLILNVHHAHDARNTIVLSLFSMDISSVAKDYELIGGDAE